MELMEGLRNKNSAEAYQFLLLLEKESGEKDSLYGSLDDFLTLLQEKSSLVRTRGFRLICAQARWDREGWIGEHLGEILAVLDDGKGTEVRQCLAALHQVVLFLPELCPRVGEKLDGMDLSRQKESMAELIQKDVDELRAIMKGGMER